MIEEAVRVLLSEQNSDGGWGALKGKVSNTECTAFAVMALQSLQGKESTRSVQAGLSWLFRHQNSEGSWPLNDAAPTGSWSTAIALLCFSAFPEHRSRALKAAEWALTQEGSKPGWL